MQRVLETELKWGEMYYRNTLLWQTREAEVRVNAARGWIWNVEPELCLDLDFTNMESWLTGLLTWTARLDQILRDSGISAEFRGMCLHTGNQTVRLSFPKKQGEDSTVTVCNTLLWVLWRLGVEGSSLEATKKPWSITQRTFWRRNREDPRGLWVSHCEHLASKIKVPV